MNGYKHRPRWLVARVKGAAVAGIPYKLVAKLSGVPLSTVRHWATGVCYPEVEPDRFAVEQLEKWIKKCPDMDCNSV